MPQSRAGPGYLAVDWTGSSCRRSRAASSVVSPPPPKCASTRSRLSCAKVALDRLHSVIVRGPLFVRGFSAKPLFDKEMHACTAPLLQKVTKHPRQSSMLRASRAFGRYARSGWRPVACARRTSCHNSRAAPAARRPARDGRCRPGALAAAATLQPARIPGMEGVVSDGVPHHHARELL